MPFAEGPFGLNSLNKVPGVYGIANASHQMVYIGESENMQERLAEHMTDRQHCLWSYAPAEVFAEQVSGGEVARKRREQELITEYNPPCNKRSP